MITHSVLQTASAKILGWRTNFLKKLYLMMCCIFSSTINQKNEIFIILPQSSAIPPHKKQHYQLKLTKKVKFNSKRTTDYSTQSLNLLLVALLIILN